MKKSVKIIFTVAVIILLSFALFSCAKKDSKPLYTNGDFESTLASDAEIYGWEYYKGSGSISKKPTADHEKEALGEYYLEFATGATEGEIFISQKVKLEKGKTYKLSADFNVKDTIVGKDNDFYGAFVGFDEDLSFKTVMQITKTDGWIKKEGYFKNDFAREITLRVGIGSKTKGLAKGTAQIDNIKLEKVNTKLLPSSAIVSQIGDLNYSDKATKTGKALVAVVSILSAAFALGFGLILRKKSTSNTQPIQKLESTQKNNKLVKVMTSSGAIVSYILVVAFLIRFLVMYFVQGFLHNQSLLSNLAYDLAKYGPLKIYQNTTTIAAPGMMYILWIVGAFSKAVNLIPGMTGANMIATLPALICEMLNIFLLFFIVAKYYDTKKASIFASMYAIMPVFFISNALYSLNASILVFFAIITIYAMIEKKYMTAIILANVAWFFDYNAIFLLPVVIVYSVYHAINDKERLVDIVLAFVASVIFYYLLAVPFDYKFMADGKAFHVYEQMINHFKAYPSYATDVFNMYAIFGLINQDAMVALRVFSVIFALSIIGYMAYIYFTRSNRLDLALMAALMFVIFANIGTKATMEMHAVALGLLLLYAALSMDKRIFIIFSIYAFTFTVNLAQLLNMSGYVVGDVNASYVHFSAKNPLVIIFSIINTLTTIYLGYVTYEIMNNDNIMPHEEKSALSPTVIKEKLVEYKKIKEEEKEVIVYKKEKSEEKGQKVVKENLGIKKKETKKNEPSKKSQNPNKKK